MSEMKAGLVPAFVTHPLAVRVDVGKIRVPLHIAEVALRFASAFLALLCFASAFLALLCFASAFLALLCFASALLVLLRFAAALLRYWRLRLTPPRWSLPRFACGPRGGMYPPPTRPPRSCSCPCSRPRSCA